MRTTALYFFLFACCLLITNCSKDNGPQADKVRPTISSFLINDGDSLANSRFVTLAILAHDNEGLAGMQMRCSNRADFSDCNWMKYATTMTHELTLGSGLKVVYAEVKDAAGNVSLPDSDSIVLDTTYPVIDTFLINGGDAKTSQRAVMVTVAASDDAGTIGLKMRVSEDPGFLGIAWDSYRRFVPYVLSSGDGVKTLYGQVRDASGKISQTVTDAILLETEDTVPPIISEFLINGGSATTDSRDVTLTIVADDDRGLAGMKMRIADDPSFIGSSWVNYQQTFLFRLLDGDGLKTVYTQVRDASDNTSQIASDDITLETKDTTPPVIDEFLINSGDVMTNVRDATLTIVASDDKGLTGMQMRVGSDPSFIGSSWVDYQQTLPYTLPEGDGLKTVYGQVRDRSLNASDPASDGIYLYTTSTLVHADPDTLYIDAGNTGTIHIEIKNALSLFSAKFVLSFDPSALEVSDVTVDLGSSHILSSTGAKLLVSDNYYDNQRGIIRIGALAQQENFTGVTGDGLFAIIKLRATSAFGGAKQLSFISYEVYDFPISNPPVPATNVIVIPGTVSYRHGE